jgi:hypothetical protein
MNKRQIEKRISLIPESGLNNVYINDPEYLFLLKKTEKIVMSTYLLTDFIPSSESLKKALKDNSHESLNFVSEFLHKRNDRIHCVSCIKASFMKMLTQYDLAHISGFISRMNVQIVKDEINNLLRIVDDLERELSDEKAPDFKQNYFNVDARQKRHYETATIPKKDKKDKDTVGVLNKKSNVSYNNSSKKVNTVSNAMEREEKIIEIIKDKKIVSIKDISEIILDCSEKTIQRTLGKMVDVGKIAKTGERRWAKYHLA